MVTTERGLWRRFTAAALLAVFAAGAVVMVDAPHSDAADSVAVAAPNRAVLYVDAGTGPVNYCITFSGTISGIEAIGLAGLDTVVSGYGGLGAAVCAIGGQGCAAGACLTCQAPNYWNYLRSADGGPFAISVAGASSTAVSDGDVEGWIWGSQVATPPTPSVDSVCGPAPTTTTAPPPAPPAPPPSPAPPAPPPALQPGDPGVTSPLRPGLPPSTAVAAVGPTATDPATAGATTSEPDPGAPTTEGPVEVEEFAERDDGPAFETAAADPGEVAVAPDLDEGGGSASLFGVAAAVVLLAGVASWIVVLRRRATG